MKRLQPLLLAILAVLLIGGALLWKILKADDCMERGGIVVAPMSRSQQCADP